MHYDLIKEKCTLEIFVLHCFIKKGVSSDETKGTLHDNDEIKMENQNYPLSNRFVKFKMLYFTAKPVIGGHFEKKHYMPTN